MPLIIPKTLPAFDALYEENVFVMHRERALAQHIRPLEILILNLMPTKIATETQIARLLANTPLQVHMTLLQTASHSATHVSAAHLEAFYKTFDEVKNNRYDGMIITGAPVETMDFEQVDYWKRTVRDHGLQRNERLFHPPCLLGRTGRAVLPLRRAQAVAAGKDVWRVRAPGHPPGKPACARL